MGLGGQCSEVLVALTLCHEADQQSVSGVYNGCQRAMFCVSYGLGEV